MWKSAMQTEMDALMQNGIGHAGYSSTTPSVRHGLGGLHRHVRWYVGCHHRFRRPTIVPVSPNMRTTPRGSSCDLMLQNQHTTPRSVSRCMLSSNWPCASL